MAGENGQKFDHVVSVMFENRTFGNLLGRLYQPGEVPSFEGVLGKELTNPIPDWAEHGADRKVVPTASRRA
jgi:phospholipase C